MTLRAFLPSKKYTLRVRIENSYLTHILQAGEHKYALALLTLPLINRIDGFLNLLYRQ